MSNIPDIDNWFKDILVGNLYCPFKECTWSFFTSFELADHIRNDCRFGKYEGNVPCTHCGITFKADELKSHWRHCHKDIVSTLNGLYKGNIQKCPNYMCPEEFPATFIGCKKYTKHSIACHPLFLCKSCNNEYTSRNILQQHKCSGVKKVEPRKSVSRQEVEVDRNLLNRPSLASREEKNLVEDWQKKISNGIFGCPVPSCDKTFFVPNHFITHLQKEAKLDNIFKHITDIYCPYCPKNISWNIFQRHMQNNHREIVEFVNLLKSGETCRCPNYKCASQQQYAAANGIDYIQHSIKCRPLFCCSHCQSEFKNQKTFDKHQLNCGTTVLKKCIKKGNPSENSSTDDVNSPKKHLNTRSTTGNIRYGAKKMKNTPFASRKFDDSSDSSDGSRLMKKRFKQENTGENTADSNQVKKFNNKQKLNSYNNTIKRIGHGVKKEFRRKRFSNKNHTTQNDLPIHFSTTSDTCEKDNSEAQSICITTDQSGPSFPDIIPTDSCRTKSFLQRAIKRNVQEKMKAKLLSRPRENELSIGAATTKSKRKSTPIRSIIHSKTNEIALVPADDEVEVIVDEVASNSLQAAPNIIDAHVFEKSKTASNMKHLIDVWLSNIKCGIWTCVYPNCDQTFYLPNAFYNHITSYRQDDPLREKIFNAKLTCCFCQEAISIPAFVRHFKQKHSNVLSRNVSFVCPYEKCLKSFSKGEDYLKHVCNCPVAQKEKEDEKEEERKKGLMKKWQSDLNKGIFQCPNELCNQNFMMPGLLVDHMKCCNLNDICEYILQIQFVICPWDSQEVNIMEFGNHFESKHGQIAEVIVSNPSSFACPNFNCVTQFQSVSDFLNHTVSCPTCIICADCSMTFTCHEEYKQHDCPGKDPIFLQKSLDLWYNQVRSGQLKCPQSLCSAWFFTLDKFVDHIKECAKKSFICNEIVKRDILPCSFCPTSLSFQDSLNHMKVSHLKILENLQQIVQKHIIHCLNYKCQKEFRDGVRYFHHASICKPLYQCGQCNKEFQIFSAFSSHSCSTDLNNKRKKGNDWYSNLKDAIYYCPSSKCNLRFKTFESLLPHLQICKKDTACENVLNEGVFGCCICKEDIQISDFLNHFKLNHSKVMIGLSTLSLAHTFRCNVKECKKVFVDRGKFLQHAMKCNRCSQCEGICVNYADCKRNSQLKQNIEQWHKEIINGNLVCPNKGCLKKHTFIEQFINHLHNCRVGRASAKALTTAIPCLICKKMFTAQELSDHFKSKHTVVFAQLRLVEQGICIHCPSSSCRQAFAYGTAYLHHIATKCQPIMTCGKCSKSFDSKERLKSHVCSKNKGSEKSQHKLWDKLSQTPWYDQVMKGDLRCPNSQCTAEFILPRDFIQHLRRCSEGGECAIILKHNELPCCFCKTYVSLGKYCSHLSACHKEGMRKALEETQDNPKETVGYSSNVESMDKTSESSDDNSVVTKKGRNRKATPRKLSRSGDLNTDDDPPVLQTISSPDKIIEETAPTTTQAHLSSPNKVLHETSSEVPETAFSDFVIETSTSVLSETEILSHHFPSEDEITSHVDENAGITHLSTKEDDVSKQTDTLSVAKTNFNAVQLENNENVNEDSSHSCLQKAIAKETEGSKMDENSQNKDDTFEKLKEKIRTRPKNRRKITDDKEVINLVHEFLKKKRKKTRFAHRTSMCAQMGQWTITNKPIRVKLEEGMHENQTSSSLHNEDFQKHDESVHQQVTYTKIISLSKKDQPPCHGKEDLLNDKSIVESAHVTLQEVTSEVVANSVEVSKSFDEYSETSLETHETSLTTADEFTEHQVTSETDITVPRQCNDDVLLKAKITVKKIKNERPLKEYGLRRSRRGKKVSLMETHSKQSSDITSNQDVNDDRKIQDAISPARVTEPSEISSEQNHDHKMQDPNSPRSVTDTIEISSEQNHDRKIQDAISPARVTEPSEVSSEQNHDRKIQDAISPARVTETSEVSSEQNHDRKIQDPNSPRSVTDIIEISSEQNDDRKVQDLISPVRVAETSEIHSDQNDDPKIEDDIEEITANEDEEHESQEHITPTRITRSKVVEAYKIKVEAQANQYFPKRHDSTQKLKAVDRNNMSSECSPPKFLTRSKIKNDPNKEKETDIIRKSLEREIEDPSTERRIKTSGMARNRSSEIISRQLPSTDIDVINLSNETNDTKMRTRMEDVEVQVADIFKHKSKQEKNTSNWNSKIKVEDVMLDHFNTVFSENEDEYCEKNIVDEVGNLSHRENLKSETDYNEEEIENTEVEKADVPYVSIKLFPKIEKTSSETTSSVFSNQVRSEQSSSTEIVEEISNDVSSHQIAELMDSDISSNGEGEDDPNVVDIDEIDISYKLFDTNTCSDEVLNKDLASEKETKKAIEFEHENDKVTCSLNQGISKLPVKNKQVELIEKKSNAKRKLDKGNDEDLNVGVKKVPSVSLEKKENKSRPASSKKLSVGRRFKYSKITAKTKNNKIPENKNSAPEKTLEKSIDTSSLDIDKNIAPKSQVTASLLTLMSISSDSVLKTTAKEKPIKNELNRSYSKETTKDIINETIENLISPNFQQEQAGFVCVPIEIPSFPAIHIPIHDDDNEQFHENSSSCFIDFKIESTVDKPESTTQTKSMLPVIHTGQFEPPTFDSVENLITDADVNPEALNEESNHAENGSSSSIMNQSAQFESFDDTPVSYEESLSTHTPGPQLRQMLFLLPKTEDDKTPEIQHDKKDEVSSHDPEINQEIFKPETNNLNLAENSNLQACDEESSKERQDIEKTLADLLNAVITGSSSNIDVIPHECRMEKNERIPPKPKSIATWKEGVFNYDCSCLYTKCTQKFLSPTLMFGHMSNCKFDKKKSEWNKIKSLSLKCPECSEEHIACVKYSNHYRTKHHPLMKMLSDLQVEGKFTFCPNYKCGKKILSLEECLHHYRTCSFLFKCDLCNKEINNHRKIKSHLISCKSKKAKKEENNLESESEMITVAKISADDSLPLELENRIYHGNTTNTSLDESQEMLITQSTAKISVEDSYGEISSMDNTDNSSLTFKFNFKHSGNSSWKENAKEESHRLPCEGFDEGTPESNTDCNTLSPSTQKKPEIRIIDIQVNGEKCQVKRKNKVCSKWAELVGAYTFCCPSEECDGVTFLCLNSMIRHVKICLKKNEKELKCFLTTKIKCPECQRPYLAERLHKHFSKQHLLLNWYFEQVEIGNWAICQNYKCAKYMDAREEIISHYRSCNYLWKCKYCAVEYSDEVFVSKHHCRTSSESDGNEIDEEEHGENLETTGNDLKKKEHMKIDIDDWLYELQKFHLKCPIQKCDYETYAYSQVFAHIKVCPYISDPNQKEIILQQIEDMTMKCPVSGCSRSAESETIKKFTIHFNSQHKIFTMSLRNLQEEGKTSCLNYLCHAELTTKEDVLHHCHTCKFLWKCCTCNAVYENVRHQLKHTCISKNTTGKGTGGKSEVLSVDGKRRKRKSAAKAINMMSSLINEVENKKMKTEIDDDDQRKNKSYANASETEDESFSAPSDASNGTSDEWDDNDNNDGDGDAEEDDNSGIEEDQLDDKVSKNYKTGKIGTCSRIKDFYDSTFFEKWLKENKPLKSLFPSLVATQASIKVLPENSYINYLPHITESLSIEIEYHNRHKKKVVSPTVLKRFEVMDALEGSCSMSFNTGGSVWALQWCPLKADQDQYLAVATHNSNAEVHCIVDVTFEKGLIQLWKIGKLKGKEKPLPKFSLGICHNYGPIYDFKWCPFGYLANQQSDVTSKKNRLGLLAAACGDGKVRILSIPEPDSMFDEKPVFVELEPELVLAPLKSCSFERSRTGMCLCVEWLPQKEYNLVAAGYGDGGVRIWDISTSSIFLRIEEMGRPVLLPPIFIHAHSYAVRSIAWCPYNSNIIATASADKMLKVFDINQPNNPIFTLKKGVLLDVQWPVPRLALYFSEDDCLNVVPSSARALVLEHLFRDQKLEKDIPHPTTRHNAAVFSCSYNNYLDLMATGDAAGELIVCKNQDVIGTKSKDFTRKTEPVYRIVRKWMDINSSPSIITNKDVENACTEKDADCIDLLEEYSRCKERNENTFQQYSYKFLDSNQFEYTQQRKKKDPDLMRCLKIDNLQSNDVQQYETRSIQKVTWNPNYGCHTWLASGTRLGIVRIHCFKAWQ